MKYQKRWLVIVIMVYSALVIWNLSFVVALDLPSDKITADTVFWGHTGKKIHIDANCHTIKRGAFSGTLEQGKDAGHTGGWCGVCSKGWTDEKFLRGVNLL